MNTDWEELIAIQKSADKITITPMWGPVVDLVVVTDALFWNGLTLLDVDDTVLLDDEQGLYFDSDTPKHMSAAMYIVSRLSFGLDATFKVTNEVDDDIEIIEGYLD